ncbi:MAG: hypothetical protein AAF230_00040 [Pseudomonadota bacterium]
MNYGRLKTSPRLQRALRALQRAEGEISTMELSRRARICAVNSVVAELRANGAEIRCRKGHDANKRMRFFYTLVKSPKGYDA